MHGFFTLSGATSYDKVIYFICVRYISIPASVWPSAYFRNDGYLEDVFDHMMSILIELHKNEKFRKQGQRIYKVYSYNVFRDLKEEQVDWTEKNAYPNIHHMLLRTESTYAKVHGSISAWLHCKEKKNL